MATMALAENPSIVLRRVQDAELVELPSLPSFTPDFGDDETDDYYGANSTSTRQEENEDDMSTPHVARYRSPPRTGSTIVPRHRTPLQPTPLSKRADSPAAFTSTPYTEQLRLSSNQSAGSVDSRQSRQYDDSYSAASEASAQTGTGAAGDDVSDLPDPSLESSFASVIDTPMPRAFAKKQSQVKTKLSPLNVADRIPSLSRSEVSGTDNEATTPDASHGQFEHVEVPVQEYSTHDYTTHEFPDEYDATSASVTPPTESRNHSPVKEGTPSAQRFMDVPNTAIRSAATPFAGHTAPLNDVTSTYRNREAYREATPSPQKMPATPASEYATPRPLASAADRRKSHLLTVLQSSKLPSKFKAKGTPHSVRRVSLAPDVASLAEEGNSTLDASFVSIASSQDLTLDRRASRLHARGNTSVPNIVLGTGMAESPSGPEVRIEFAKISKHTNMMNDALNEENAALAAELKIWQDEVKWMTDALSVKGIEITDDGEVVVPAQAQEDVPTASPKKAACDHDDYDQITAERDEAVERHAELEEELRNHVKTFEDIGDDFKQQIEKLEADLEAAKADANRLESEASRRREGAPTKDIDAHLQEIAKLEEELAYAQEEAQAADAAADKARKELADLQFEHEDVTEQLQHAKEDVEQLREQLDDVHHDDDERVARLKAQVAELEEEKKSTLSALSTAKGHIEDLQDELAAQEAKVRAQQATIVDLETKDDELVKVDKALRIETERKVSDARDALADRDAEIASLQAALDVARMTGDRTLGESSAVAALQERLDDAHHEIEQLRKERAAAADSEFALKSRDARITALENEKEMLVERLRARTPGAGMGGTPMRSMRSSTPLVNRILAGLHSPKTPGTPLRDMSWLQTTTDSQESLLRARLEVLQDELEAANVQLDKNFGRLEQAGVSSVGNAEQLVRARQRIDELEAQLRDLARKNKQSLASLGLRESRIEHRNERLETALDAVKAEMESMRVDHAAQCDHLANEARRLRVAFHDLDNKYQEEIEELGEQIVAMRREEDDKIRDAEDKADALASENEALNSKLKSARATIGTLQRDIDTLRADRPGASALRALEVQLREATDERSKLRETARERTRALDAAELQIDTLRRDRDRVARELATFSEDLKTQRRACAQFGTELDALHREAGEKERKARRDVAQLEADLGWARERLDATEGEKRVLAVASATSSAVSADTAQVTAHYRRQIGILAARIEYLKAKYTRENTFRNALARQKKYLYLCLGGYSVNEQETIRRIATFGVPALEAPRPRRTLKTVAIAVIAILRVRQLAEEWRATKEVQEVKTGRSERSERAERR